MGSTGEISIVQFDAAFSAGYQADNHVETGGLAGTVRSQQPDDLAAAYRQRDISTTWRDL